MSIRPIVYYPDDVLTTRAEEITEFGEDLASLVEDMAETMYAADGLGLAANQVGVTERVFIIDMGGLAEEYGLEPGPMVFVNPRIVERSGKITWEEGCLSFPGLTVKVERSEFVRIQAQDLDGEPFELEGDGLFAVALQHESDHLDGITMVDRLGKLSKKMALRRYARSRAKEVG